MTSHWSNPIDRYEIETALDAGRLYFAMSNGNWYQLRRNGRTRTWRRAPERFAIPVKWGLYGYGVVDEGMPLVNLRIADSRNAAEKKVEANVPDGGVREGDREAISNN
jgi:hypothetical protein